MVRVIAVTNQKGGVGKTTTSINLAASFAATKRKVLLIDLDPQGNATSGSGFDKNDVHPNIFDVLVGESLAEEAIFKTEESGYDVIPGNRDLSAAEVHLLDMESKEYRLLYALKLIKERYDFIFIDCPPSLNMLTINALVAADSIIIPMQCEYYALEGITALLETIEQISQRINPKLHIEGILRTMYDPRNRLATEVSHQLHEHFGEKVYRTVIPRNVRLAEAPSYGLPALQYDRLSKGAKCYLALAGEILRRQELTSEQQTPEVNA